LLLMLLALLVGTLNLASRVEKAEASGTIYIRADGSIDPPDAPISTADNVTYTFVGNISDSIVVERDNIVVDGAGYTVQGTGSSGTGLGLSGRSYVTLKNMRITAFRQGVLLHESSSNLLCGNNITANNDGYGIWLYSSSNNNSVSGNNITTSNNDGYGIILDSSSGNSVSGNNITANNDADGILLYSSSNSNSICRNNIAANDGTGVTLQEHSNNNTVCKNDIANSDYGIALSYSSNSNFICENNVAGNRRGILLYRASSNRVYHNDFVANIEQVDSQQSVNVWDDGYPSGGNFWSDYNGTDANHDGIGDTPYITDANDADRYPLMGMFQSFSTSSGKHLTVVSNSTIEDVDFYSKYSIVEKIKMHVSNMTVNQTCGFCLVCIPHDLMLEGYNVTIDGTTPLYSDYVVYDNSTHRWIYFTYQHPAKEIIIKLVYNNEAKFKGRVMSNEWHSFLCYGAYMRHVKVDEILYDPSGLLMPNDTVTIAYEYPKNWTTGDEVECYGMYYKYGGPRGYIGFFVCKWSPYYAIPEFPSFLILPLFFTATLLAVIAYKRKQADRR